MTPDDELLASLRENAGPRSTGTGAPTPRACRPPASEEAVVRAEEELGFRLDSLLRRVYREAFDGGFGPGYGSLPLTGRESLVSTHGSFRSGSWPEKLLPVWDWGGAVWSCVDPEGRIITHDDVGGRTLTCFKTRTWLRAWVDDVDLWKEIYEDRDSTIVNPFTRQPVATKVRGTAKGWPSPV